MARFEGFIGGSYTGRAMAADAERSVNWFPERVESQGGAQKSEIILLPKPGLAQFSALTGATAIQALAEINGRAFAVASGDFYEIHNDGRNVNYGPVANGRAQMVASQTQVLILADSSGFVFTLATNTLAPVPSFPAGITKLAVADGYFLALESGSQNFYFSALNDGTSWNPLDYGNAQGEPGSFVSFVIDHRQMWLLSSTHSEIYYDSGNALNPWTRLEGAFMEQGCAAVDSPATVDNSIMWLGGNSDGAGVVWRANGYTPQRVSTHAVETAIQSYPTFADASGYCYQEGGHTFYRLDFPSANSGLGATWVYDIASGFWHERTYYNPSTNSEQADLARTHIYAFGLHLVGDYQSGTIYQQSQNYATDNGAPMRRLRSAPDISNGGEWTFYSELRLLAQVGVGLDGGVVPGSNPQIVLQSSDDGGFTWGNERSISMGAIGQYKTLIRWRQLGRSQNRAFRVICTEPVFAALIAADLDANGDK